MLAGTVESGNKGNVRECYQRETVYYVQRLVFVIELNSKERYLVSKFLF